MMYTTIIFLWLTLGLVIFTRTLAFPARSKNSHNTHEVSLHSPNARGFVRIKGSHVDSLAFTKDDRSAKLQMKSFTVNGSVVVTIQPREKNSYLCVNSDGNLTVETPSNVMSRCLFIEGERSGYTTFRSHHNRNWYLGFKRNGKVKQPHNTTESQKAARFIIYKTHLTSP